jgi:hypothetical protein
LLHGRHPLYPVIIGVPPGLIPNQESSGKPPICGDPCLCADKVLEIPQATTPATPTPRPTPTWDEIQQHIAQLRANGEDSRSIELYLEQGMAYHRGSLMLSHCLASMFPTLIRQSLRPGLLGLRCPSEFMDDA